MEEASTKIRQYRQHRIIGEGTHMAAIRADLACGRGRLKQFLWESGSLQPYIISSFLLLLSLDAPVSKPETAPTQPLVTQEDHAQMHRFMT